MEERIENDVVIEESVEHKKKTPCKNRLSVRAIAFIAFLIVSVIMLASIVAIAIFFETDIYSTPKEVAIDGEWDSLSNRNAGEVFQYLTNDQKERADVFCNNSNIASMKFTFSDSNKVYYSYGTQVVGAHVYTSEWYYYDPQQSENYSESYEYDSEDVSWSNGETNVYEDASEELVLCEVTVMEPLAYQDNYAWIVDAFDVAYAMRYWIYVITFVSLVFLIADFIFLMSAAGHKSEDDLIHPGMFTGIPTDVFTGLTCLLGILLLYLFLIMIRDLMPGLAIVFTIILYFICGSIALGWCMSIATRVKLGVIWKSCWCYRILAFFIRGMKYLFRVFQQSIYDLKITTSVVLIYSGISIVEFFVILVVGARNGDGSILLPWFFEKIILFVIIIYYFAGIKKLFQLGEDMASGKLTNQVNEKSLPVCMRKMYHNLNRLQDSVRIAVQEQMKSERMKTDLITNVSHDIKTPLTSIINYADLISKEECDNLNIKEYSEVLSRQSDRLKSLINDLVEASKASSGNLEVEMVPTIANVLIAQAVGEYEARLSKKELTLVVNSPEENVNIMADGRRLWRVIDNLMNNICKYAQPGTRVYLTLEKAEGFAAISFKNTSKEPLNVSPEELMERFTRGDASRHTEGNGLGLAIAKSLVELQNGSLQITIDGDLFKAIVKFAIIE